MSFHLQTDNKLVIGGFFDDVGGAAHNGVTRLNPDGSVDADFNPPAAAFTRTVVDVLVQPDGKILFAGGFVNISGVAGTADLARFNSDGSLDTSFRPNVGARVFSVDLQSADENIIIAGQFTSVGGTTSNRLARLENIFGRDIAFAASPQNQRQIRVEGNDAQSVFNFTVSRTSLTSGESSVDYRVSAGATNSATADDFVDDVFTPRTLTFADGESSKTISIAVRGDTEIESNEEFIITLSNPVNAIIGSANEARGIIQDDDASPLCLPVQPSNGKVAIVCL